MAGSYKQRSGLASIASSDYDTRMALFKSVKVVQTNGSTKEFKNVDRAEVKPGEKEPQTKVEIQGPDLFEILTMDADQLAELIFGI